MQNDQSTGIHPIEFAHQIDDLVRRLDTIVRSIPAHRSPTFRTHNRQLAAGAFTTITEDFRPDKWIILTDSNPDTMIGVFPSNGQPVYPDMFRIGASDSATIPGISQYLSITNLGPQTTSVVVMPVTGFDFEYQPPSNSGSITVTSGVAFAAITPSDTVALNPIPRALYVGTGGDVVVRGANDAADTTFIAVPTGTTLQIGPQYVRFTNTTATNIVGIY